MHTHTHTHAHTHISGCLWATFWGYSVFTLAFDCQCVHACMTAIGCICPCVCVCVCERDFARLALAALGWSRAAKRAWKAAFVAQASWELRAHAQGLAPPRYGSNAWKWVSLFIKHILWLSHTNLKLGVRKRWRDVLVNCGFVVVRAHHKQRAFVGEVW